MTDALHRDRLKVAFALSISQLLVRADGVIVPDERAFLEEMFPQTMLVRLGLDDPERYAEVRDLAFRDVASVLDRDEKLQLLGLFFAVCEVDADIDVRELEVVTLAADQLGLSFDDVVARLTGLFDVPQDPPEGSPEG